MNTYVQGTYITLLVIKQQLPSLMHRMTGYFRSTSENISFTGKGTHINISDGIRHSIFSFFCDQRSENAVSGVESNGESPGFLSCGI